MAAGTFTAGTPDPDNVLGRWRVRHVTYTGAASYVAGGDVPPALGLRSIRGVIILGINSALYVPFWNPSTGKLQFLWTGPAISGPLAEVAATTNLSAVVVQLLFISNDD
jgi:hypothetical protein